MRADQLQVYYFSKNNRTTTHIPHSPNAIDNQLLSEYTDRTKEEFLVGGIKN